MCDGTYCKHSGPFFSSGYHYCLNNIECPVGQYPGEYACTVCPDKYECRWGPGPPQPCLVGHYCTGGNVIACPVNKYCPPLTSIPISCPAGASSPAYSTRLSDCVTPCQTGYDCTAGSPYTCIAGYSKKTFSYENSTIYQGISTSNSGNLIVETMEGRQVYYASAYFYVFPAGFPMQASVTFTFYDVIGSGNFLDW